MNDVLRIARLKIALQRAFLRRAILIFTACSVNVGELDTTGICVSGSECNARSGIIIGQF